MKVRYEEKTYENYFNIELAERSEVFYPPGQVQEGFLGFDASALSQNRRFWRLLGHPFWFFHPFQGVRLREIADEIEINFNDVVRSVPQLKLNLLLQYKRPEYMTQSSSAEWSSWSQKYFRYDLDDEQHERLLYIDDKFGNKVLVLYAAPALRNVNELVQTHIERKIIENSNFKKVVELASHHRNTYVNAGTYSIACSEPKRIEDFDLIRELEHYAEETSENSNEKDNEKFIVDFRKGIEAIVLEDSVYSEPFKLINKELEPYRRYKLLYSFLLMANFRSLTGIQWIVKL